MIRIIGTTLLGVVGACGTAAVWSHVHDSHAAEARGNSRRPQYSRRERGDSNFARDFAPRRRRGGAREERAR